MRQHFAPHSSKGARVKIENNTVVHFHYKVGEPGQPATESSFERDPVAALIGHGGIIPGMEEALMGREAGERFELTVEPDKGYGQRDESRIQRLPKKHFGNLRIQPGQQVNLKTRQGPRVVTIRKVGVSVVDVDLNHPMAGKTLAFEVEVVSVRAASEVEIQHRHVHGDGGVEH